MIFNAKELTYFPANLQIPLDTQLEYFLRICANNNFVKFLGIQIIVLSKIAIFPISSKSSYS